MALRERGIVRWFDVSKCHGYIKSELGEDIFVSYSSFSDKDNCFLVIGSKVEFSVVDTDAGARVEDLIVVE